MSRADTPKLRLLKPATEASPRPCDRRDLADWSGRGGVLPRRLARHVACCPGCAAQVRRMNQVFASLRLLQTQAVPPNTLARSNGRALRMLRRVARASASAARLLRSRPNLTPWQRVGLHAARLSLGAAAAVLMLILRTGITSGFDRTRVLGEQLASAHWDRHIDPDHEWLDPTHLA